MGYPLVTAKRLNQLYDCYFKQNRAKDLELFFFPTELGFFSPYSIKCGAVDKRQPILLSKTEINNLELKNPDGYKLLEPTILNYQKDIEPLKLNTDSISPSKSGVFIADSDCQRWSRWVIAFNFGSWLC